MMYFLSDIKNINSSYCSKGKKICTGESCGDRYSTAGVGGGGGGAVSGQFVWGGAQAFNR